MSDELEQIIFQSEHDTLYTLKNLEILIPKDYQLSHSNLGPQSDVFQISNTTDFGKMKFSIIIDKIPSSSSFSEYVSELVNPLKNSRDITLYESSYFNNYKYSYSQDYVVEKPNTPIRYCRAAFIGLNWGNIVTYVYALHLEGSGDNKDLIFSEIERVSRSVFIINTTTDMLR